MLVAPRTSPIVVQHQLYARDHRTHRRLHSVLHTNHDWLGDSLYLLLDPLILPDVVVSRLGASLDDAHDCRLFEWLHPNGALLYLPSLDGKAVLQGLLFRLYIDSVYGDMFPHAPLHLPRGNELHSNCCCPSTRLSVDRTACTFTIGTFAGSS